MNGLREYPTATIIPKTGSSEWCYPRNFPEGIWNMAKSIPKDGSDKYLGTVFIPTDEYQEVSVYGDAKFAMPSGENLEPTGMQVDVGYGLHFSSDVYTQGCIKFETQAAADEFSELSDKALSTNNGTSTLYVYDDLSHLESFLE